MKTFGDDEALVTDDRRYTYAEVRAGVRAMSSALWNHGIRPGQTIGVFAYNPAESIFLQLGAHMFGARVAFAASTEPMRFRHDFLRLAGIDAFVYDARDEDAVVIGTELARVAAPLPVFCFGRGSGPDLTSTIGTTGEDLPYDPTNVTVEPSTLVQTGGTTALAKLVHHRHGFFANLRTFADYYRASDAPRLRHLLQSGTWHIKPQTAAYMTLFSGGTLFLKQGIQNGPFLDIIGRERINSRLHRAARALPVARRPRVDRSGGSELDADVDAVRQRGRAVAVAGRLGAARPGDPGGLRHDRVPDDRRDAERRRRPGAPRASGLVRPAVRRRADQDPRRRRQVTADRRGR